MKRKEAANDDANWGRIKGQHSPPLTKLYGVEK